MYTNLTSISVLHESSVELCKPLKITDTISSGGYETRIDFLGKTSTAFSFYSKASTKTSAADRFLLTCNVPILEQVRFYDGNLYMHYHGISCNKLQTILEQIASSRDGRTHKFARFDVKGRSQIHAICSRLCLSVASRKDPLMGSKSIYVRSGNVTLTDIVAAEFTGRGNQHMYTLHVPNGWQLPVDYQVPELHDFTEPPPCFEVLEPLDCEGLSLHIDETVEDTDTDFKPIKIECEELPESPPTTSHAWEAPPQIPLDAATEHSDINQCDWPVPPLPSDIEELAHDAWEPSQVPLDEIPPAE